MREIKEEIIVGVLGQWASGKTTAARTLISYLGGRDEVTFITDKELFAGQAIKHILELDESRVTFTIEEDGRRRLDGGRVSVWLGPGETLESVDLSTLWFYVPDDLMPAWHHRARGELGHQILERSADGLPIVIEAAYGPDVEMQKGNTYRLTIADLFSRLEEAGVEAKQAKWIIVKAGRDVRSERNQKRSAKVPIDKFDRYSSDGGDLDPDQQMRLENQGTMFRRVPNDHDDIERFRSEIIAAFDDLFSGL